MENEITLLLQSNFEKTKLINSQQEQISELLFVFDKLLENPDLLRQKRSALVQFVQNVRAHHKIAGVIHSHLRIFDVD